MTYDPGDHLPESLWRWARESDWRQQVTPPMDICRKINNLKCFDCLFSSILALHSGLFWFFNCRFRSLIVQLLDHGREPTENLEQGLGWHFLFISRWEFPWRYHRAVIQLINVICHWVWRHRSSGRPGSALWDRRRGTGAPSQQPHHCQLPPSLPLSLPPLDKHVACAVSCSGRGYIREMEM